MNHSRSSHINFYSAENYEERLCRWAVDAGESSLPPDIRKSSLRWPHSSAQSGMAWRLTSLPKSFSVEATTRSFHLYKTAIRHHSPPASIRMRVDGFAGRLIVRTTVRQLSIIFNHGGVGMLEMTGKCATAPSRGGRSGWIFSPTGWATPSVPLSTPDGDCWSPVRRWRTARAPTAANPMPAKNPIRAADTLGLDADASRGKHRHRPSRRRCHRRHQRCWRVRRCQHHRNTMWRSQNPRPAWWCQQDTGFD